MEGIGTWWLFTGKGWGGDESAIKQDVDLLRKGDFRGIIAFVNMAAGRSLAQFEDWSNVLCKENEEAAQRSLKLRVGRSGLKKTETSSCSQRG